MEDREMFSTFNMGIGLILVVAESQVDALRSHCAELRQMGRMQAGEGVQISGIDF